MAEFGIVVKIGFSSTVLGGHFMGFWKFHADLLAEFVDGVVDELFATEDEGIGHGSGFFAEREGHGG